MASSSPTSWASYRPQSMDETSPYINLSLRNFATPQVAAAFVLGAASAIGAITLHARYFKRIPTSDWVHPSLLSRKKWIKGVVTSVGDADNFRLYHTPGLFWRWPLNLRRVPRNVKDLKDETIHIRMAGVDAPEASHFGKPAQPYSVEALNWLKNEVEGKRLWVQMIRRDQYGRIVAIPILPPKLPFFHPPASRCVSISMLRAGFARTYEQSGAEYGWWGKEEFLRYEEKARSTKRGMWGSKEAIESPSDYKRRMRERTDEPTTTANAQGRSQSAKKKQGGWLGSIKFWG